MTTSALPPPLPPDRLDAKKREDRYLALVAKVASGVLVAAFLTLVVLKGLGLIRIYVVPGAAMSPAIASGDHIVVNGFKSAAKNPERGDVVVFKTDGISSLPPSTVYVMRLVGMPGDRLAISGGTLYVNGQQHELRNKEGEIHYVTMRSSRHLAWDGDEIAVPEGHYFVLGDNSGHSADSRFWGFLPTESILGKAAFCYWPPQHWGAVR